MKARKTHEMESCKEADIEENIELPNESLQKIEFVSIEILSLNQFSTRKTKNTMLLI